MMTVEQPVRPREPQSAVPTMRAVVQYEYGEARDVLRPERIDRPAPGEGEVLLRVHAVGVERGVWHFMAGRPNVVRLVTGIRAPRTRVRGREVAGRVEAVGTGVTGFRPGAEVVGLVGLLGGAFAEYAVAKAGKLVPKPPNVSFEQAAAAPVSGSTALQAVRDAAKVQPGQHVLVIGASGGVGSFAVQIAKAFGAEVTGVCSTAKLDLVRSIGADHVVDYRRTEITETGRRYDVILDTGGHRPLRLLRRALTPRGTLVIIGSETSGRWLGGLDRQMRAALLSPFVGQKLVWFNTSENAADLVALTELMASGKLTPAVERTYPLEETATAVQHMSDGLATGKVVVTVGEQP
jgi:NADPH:quinone reductase-like Zn-dependent oxidoreductase